MKGHEAQPLQNCGNPFKFVCNREMNNTIDSHHFRTSQLHMGVVNVSAEQLV